MPRFPHITWTTPRVAALAGMSLLAGTALFGVAYAQTPTPTVTPTPTRQQKAEEHLNRFAQNLGVDAARVKEAMKQTALQYVDEALAAGKINAEQSQALRDRINSGQFGGHFGLGGPGGMGKHGHRGGPGGPGSPGHEGFGLRGPLGAAPEALAGFLGITVEQLKTELDGKSLAQVAVAHGKSPDELKQFITSSVEQALNQAVTAGRLPQAQVTQMLTMLNANLDRLINHVVEPGRFGFPGFGPRAPGVPQGAAPSGT